MGIYSNKILPWLFEWSLKSKTIDEYRNELLSDVYGDVLEIGFGTGHNLLLYPKKVDKLTAIDLNPGNTSLAKKKIKKSSIPVEHKIANCENLPFTNKSFDCVVSTFTLCSVSDIHKALHEIVRVLKPGASFHFMEHGLSNESHIQKWQNLLTPVQKKIADGCHLNRDMAQLISSHFQNVQIEAFYEKKLPKIAGYFYMGAAKVQ
ncbi:MAG: class I SAM-dependent methyltransferase [Balneolaceae bacterium]